MTSRALLILVVLGACTEGVWEDARLSVRREGIDRVHLSWPAVESVRYEVFQDGELVSETSETSYVAADLEPATRYSFRVTANHEGQALAELGGQAETPPDEPPRFEQGATPVLLPMIGRIDKTLQWPEANDDRRVARYEVSQNGNLLRTVPGTTRTITLTPPQSFGLFQVVAIDERNQRSEPITFQAGGSQMGSGRSEIGGLRLAAPAGNERYQQEPSKQYKLNR